jgi:hypothetical protein
VKTTTSHTKAVWDSGDFAGEDRRPTTRVTIQKMVASRPQYRVDETRSKDWAHSGTFISMLFGAGDQQPRELFNVQSVKWERGVDTDVGSCTIVLSNVEARNHNDPVSDSELDFPGYYTPNRGTEGYFDEWGYVKNAWRNWLVPDRLVRTYEGYGVDRTVAPEKDPHLYQSGTWLIDDVDISTEGTITLTCRDLGRVLLDQILFYGLIPHDIYPLWFSPYEDRGKKQLAVATDNAAGWVMPKYERSSNNYYAKRPDLKDRQQGGGSRPLVASDGTVYGHHPRDAFDPGETYSYWASEGYKTKRARDGFPYIQGKMATPVHVEGIKVDAQHGPYRLYVSLQDADGKWLGNKRIPYRAGDVDTNANIPYVAEFDIDKGETATFKLSKRYANIKKVRYTFGQLPFLGFGLNHTHHAVINAVYYCGNVTLQNQAGTWKNGNYGDYTDIVKWLLSWAGWFWPNEASGLTSQRYSDGEVYQYAPSSNDPVLIEGRAWGDFETTGTTGIDGTKFDVDTWDKKPIMDGIAVIRDITGFDFWIDETGGAIWRLPNIFDKGCYVMPKKGGPRVTRTTDLVEIDERKHLVSLNVKLSSRNVREQIFVSNNAKGVGAVVKGYHPDNAGLKRYGGWTDQNFKSSDECERMADLIALKQSFTYRQNQVTITANPALQPDDQVVINERMTGEGYIHRITSISSDFDNETGRWTYTLNTNWLGTKAFTKLAWDPQKLTNATKVYLHYMGKI